MNWTAIVFTILFILAMNYVYVGYTEGLTNYGVYSCSQDNTILTNSYKKLTPQQLSDNNYENNYEIYNSFQVPMSSFNQVTNNKKLWDNPDNGLCSPSDFCNSLYSYTEYQPTLVQPPTNQQVRVNYYNSN